MSKRLAINLLPTLVAFLLLLTISCFTPLNAQEGFVSANWDIPAAGISASLGQVFTDNRISAAGYLNEGNQQPFLYRGDDTLLYQNSEYPTTYRPANRNPMGVSYSLPLGLTSDIYLLPTKGIDSLMDVMAYGVTYVNDTTVVAPYSACNHTFTLQTPLVLPAGSVPPVHYYNSAPTAYTVGAVTPVTWNFNVAQRSLTDVQQVNVKYPPCGTDNYEIYTAAADTYPFTQPLTNSIKAVDFEGNVYQTVRVGCLCWTRENLKSTKYSDGHVVLNPMVYSCSDYPDTTANLNRYGRLYTWNDAVRAPFATGSDGQAVSDVQGVCPAGWHLPTFADFQMLAAFPSADLKTTYDWQSDDGTNLTDYSALPAGKFTGIRFENLKGETFFWSSNVVSSAASTLGALNFACPDLMMLTVNNETGASVRCVKSN